MATELFAADLATTTVTSGGTTAPASGTAETWTVASSSMFGAAVTGLSQFHVADAAPAKGGEIIAVTNVAGATWTVTRGAESTTPVGHAAGFSVYQVVTAAWLATVAAVTPAVPQAQTFTLANNTYKTLQAWTVTGQTDTCSPFGIVAGSQTYGSSPAVQGPAFWFGYNPDYLSASVGSSVNGAAGMSCFADAGDSNNGAGGYGVEMNPASWIGPGGGATNALQMVAFNDATNTVVTTIRCGDGQNNGRQSQIVMQNSDATKTFITMNGITGAITVSQPVTYNAAAFSASAASQGWTVAATAGSSTLVMTAAGTGFSAGFTATSAAGTAQLLLNGNAASTVHSQVALQKAGVNQWVIQNATPYLEFVNSVNAAVHCYMIPGASFAAASTWFLSKVTAYSSLIVGSAAIATNATDGFLYLPSCAGVPAGTPTTQTGTVPCVLDTTDSKLYAYISGSWKSVTLS